MWLLGSSPDSATWAGQLALPYAFADFINPDGAVLAGSYRSTFAEHDPGSPPTVAVAVWAVCAETDEEAQYLAASSRMSMRMLRQGRLIQVPPPEKALNYLRSIGEPVDSGFTPGRRGVIGSPAARALRLEEIASAYGAEEVIVVTITFDHDARKRSYELIAEAMGIDPRPRISRFPRPRRYRSYERDLHDCRVPGRGLLLGSVAGRVGSGGCGSSMEPMS